jgi:hypothetical protein
MTGGNTGAKPSDLTPVTHHHDHRVWTRMLSDQRLSPRRHPAPIPEDVRDERPRDPVEHSGIAALTAAIPETPTQHAL